MATIPLSGTMAPLVYAPGTPSDFVQMPAPATGKGGAVDQINYGGTYTYDAPVPLTQMYTPTTFAPQYFDNTGVIVDPTLLAAQEILARPPRTRGALTPGGSGDSVSASNAPIYPAYQSAYPDAFVPVGFHSGVGDPGPVDMPSAPSTSDNGLDVSVTAPGAYMAGAILGSPAAGLLNVLPGGALISNAMANSMQDYNLQQQVSALQGAQDTPFSGGSVAPNVVGALGLASGFDGDPANTAYSAPTVAQTPTTYSPPVVSSPVIDITPGATVSDGQGGSVSVDTSGIDAAQAAMGDPEGAQAAAGDGGGGGDGGGKIICTAMNHAYGFGSYRNAIWLKYSAQHMTKAHEVGYHALFLPLVKYAFHSGDGLGNQVVRRVLEHGTRRRTADLRAEMRGTKRDALGRFYRLIFEPVCYLVGKAKGY